VEVTAIVIDLTEGWKEIGARAREVSSPLDRATDAVTFR
jgi:hypothetical protein